MSERISKAVDTAIVSAVGALIVGFFATLWMKNLQIEDNGRAIKAVVDTLTQELAKAQGRLDALEKPKNKIPVMGEIPPPVMMPPGLNVQQHEDRIRDSIKQKKDG